MLYRSRILLSAPFVLVLTLICGCAGNHLPEVFDSHPASVHAQQAAAYADSGLLSTDVPSPDLMEMGHEGHDSTASKGE